MNQPSPHTLNSRRSPFMQTVLIAMFAALSFVAIWLIRIPYPAPVGNPFFLFGNMVTILAALLIGGWQGGLSGSIGMGYIGQGAHKLCIQGNAKIFALSHVSNGDAVIGGPEVKTLEDLKGKKVGYSSGTSSEDILKNALEKAGLTMNDITAVDMDASNIVTAMLSGGVDACATWSPNSLKILEEGKDLTKLCDNTTFSDKTVSLASWIVTPSYAEAIAPVFSCFLVFSF